MSTSGNGSVSGVVSIPVNGQLQNDQNASTYQAESTQGNDTQQQNQESRPKGSLKHVDTPARKAAREKGNLVRKRMAEEKKAFKASQAVLQASLLTEASDPKKQQKNKLYQKLLEAVSSESDSEKSDASTSEDEQLLVKYIKQKVQRKKQRTELTAQQLYEFYRQDKLMRKGQLPIEEEEEEAMINEESSRQGSRQVQDNPPSNSPEYNAQNTTHVTNAPRGSINQTPFPRKTSRVVFL